MRLLKRVSFCFFIINVLVFLGHMANYGLISLHFRNVLTPQNTSIQKKIHLIWNEDIIREDAPRNNSIPKRIHQIWNDDIVPAEFADNVKSLVRDNKHPEWEFYFWTKEAGLKFVKEKYPLLYKRITAGADDTMRADILRYAVIHEYGGVYFDLDTTSVQPLNNFVDTHECALSQEPGEHYIAHNTDLLVTNSVLLCRAAHPFFKHLLLRMSNLSPNCTKAFRCSGPIVVTQLYREVNRAKVNRSDIPAVQRSELFQDVYDITDQTKRLYDKCKQRDKLKPHHIRVCDQWSLRGKEKRSLSSLALTFHTWFHVYGTKLNILKENNITLLVPHVKIFGRNF